MSKTLANVISYLFQPFMAPLVVAFLLFNSPSEFNYYIHSGIKNYIYLLYATMMLVAPIISLLIMKKFGMISAIMIPNRKQRNVPYIVVIFYFSITYLLLHMKLGHYLPPLIFVLHRAAIVSVVTIMVLNNFIKASAHLSAIGGVLASTYFLLQLNLLQDVSIFIWICIVAGVVGVARLKLKAHTLPEVCVGFVNGFAVSYLSMMF